MSCCSACFFTTFQIRTQLEKSNIILCYWDASSNIAKYASFTESNGEWRFISFYFYVTQIIIRLWLIYSAFFFSFFDYIILKVNWLKPKLQIQMLITCFIEIKQRGKKKKMAHQELDLNFHLNFHFHIMRWAWHSRMNKKMSIKFRWYTHYLIQLIHLNIAARVMVKPI